MISTFIGPGEMGDSAVTKIVRSAVQPRDEVFAIRYQLTLIVGCSIEV